MISTLQMRKLKLRGVEEVAQQCPAKQSRSWASNPGSLTPVHTFNLKLVPSYPLLFPPMEILLPDL